MRDLFSTPFKQLPEELNIFPLASTLLLPRGRLPLNIFEPRYLNMVLDSLGENRMIGMVQTLENSANPIPDDARFFKTGCAGRIVSFAETMDGRIVITLEGICRFNIVSEFGIQNGYRRIHSDFKPYAMDMDEPPQCVDRGAFFRLLKDYFEVEQIRVDWEMIEKTEDRILMANLGMMCPFNSQEKQALLEARDYSHMVEIITSLMEMAIRSCDKSSVKH